MGTALLKVGTGLLKSGGLVPRPGADSAVIAVRAGRVLYIGSAFGISMLWYWGWRNERANPGEFPIPGVTKTTIIRPGGASDAEDAAAVTLDPGTSSITDPVTRTPTDTLRGLPPTGTAPVTGSKAFLKYLGNLAPHFGLKATENPDFGGVSPVHVPGSFHYQGRAIDFVGPISNLSTFAKYLDQHYRSRLTEVIWAGPGPVAIKNGASVPSTVYRDVWANHRTHVHVAV
jgi:hypothetical protein